MLLSDFRLPDLNHLIPFSYARRSSREAKSGSKQVDSIPKQRDFIFLTSENKLPDGVQYRHYQEQQSAKQFGVRQEFYQLIDDIRVATKKENRQAYIKTIELQRLARNATDGGMIIDLMFREKLLACIITKHRIYLPSDSPSILHNEFSRSEEEIITLSSRSGTGMLRKAERGWNPAPLLPIGYRHNLEYRKTGGPEILPIDRDFTVLQELDAAMLSGSYNVMDIARLAEEKGLINPKNDKPYGHNTFRKFFTNRFYHDGFFWKNKYYPNSKHEKLRTQQEYDAIQVVLASQSRKTRPSKTKYIFPYSGLLSCACGCSMSTDHKRQVICTGCKKEGIKTKFSTKTRSSCPKCGLDEKDMLNPSIVDRCYLRCNKRSKTEICSRNSISVAKLEQQLLETLGSIELRQGFARLLREAVVQACKDTANEEEQIRQKLEKRKREILAKRERLIDKEPEMEKEEYKTLWRKADKARMKVNTAIEKIETKSTHIQEDLMTLLNFGELAAGMFRDSKDLGMRRKIVDTIKDRIRIENKTVQVDLPKALFVFSEAQYSAEFSDLLPEPKKAVVNSGPQEKSGSLSSSAQNIVPEPKNPSKTLYFSGDSAGSELKKEHIERVLPLIHQARTLIFEDYQDWKLLQKLRVSRLFGVRDGG